MTKQITSKTQTARLLGLLLLAQLTTTSVNARDETVNISSKYWDCNTVARSTYFSRAKKHFASWWSVSVSSAISPRLSFLISKTGEVSDVRVEKSSGDAETDTACFNELKKLHFDSIPEWLSRYDYSEFCVTMRTGTFNPGMEHWTIMSHPPVITYKEYTRNREKSTVDKF